MNIEKEEIILESEFLNIKELKNYLDLIKKNYEDDFELKLKRGMSDKRADVAILVAIISSTTTIFSALIPIIFDYIRNRKTNVKTNETEKVVIESKEQEKFELINESDVNKIKKMLKNKKVKKITIITDDK